jgi:phosphorylcholine metabolism protein LicD
MGGGSKTSTELMTMYKTIMDVVASAGVDVILFYGTLLGFVRGGDFIDGDDDVDVLVSHRPTSAQEGGGCNEGS